MVKKVYCDERCELSTYVVDSRLLFTIKKWNDDKQLHLSLFPTDIKELIDDLQKEMEDAFGQVYTIDKNGKAIRKDEH